jgi:hypothetical protein
MAAVFAFLGMLLISMMVALLAALQLGDFFLATEEFILVIVAVMVFCVFSLAVFAIIYAVTRRDRPITTVAMLLALIALAPVVLPGLIQMIANRSITSSAIGAEDIPITLELVIPALLAVLVQWGLVRRRWLRSAGLDDLTRWPWFTTAVAAFIILNPYGLGFLQATFKHSASEGLWEFAALITAGVLTALLVAAWLECYIRDRILRRRLAESTPSSRSATPVEFLQEAPDVRNH